MTHILRAGAMAAIAVLVASCSMFDYSSTVSKKYALVYGVTNYVSTNDWYLNNGNAGSPNLSYPHLDAIDVTSMLAAKGYTVTSRWIDGNNHVWYNGVDEGALGYYTTSSTYTPGPGDNYVPSKSNLQTDLASYKGVIGSNDVFVFYFSGHGTPGTTDEYFDPYNGVQWYPAGSGYSAGYYANPTTCVEDTEMGGFLSANIGTPRKVVILDSCNSGGFIGNTLEVDTTPPTTVGSVPGFSLSTITGPLRTTRPSRALHLPRSPPTTRR